MMTCQDSLKALETAVEQRAPLAADATEHLQHCQNAECHESYAEYVLLESTITAWKKSLPQPNPFADDLASHLIEQLHAPTLQPVSVSSQFSKRKSTSVSAVLTVSGALLLCLIMIFGTGPDDQLGTATVQQSTSPKQTEVFNSSEEIDERDLEDVDLEKISSNYLAWMQDTAHQLTGSVSVVIPSSAAVTKEDEEKKTDWLSDLADQVKPLESKLENTWQILFRGEEEEADDQTLSDEPTQNEYLGFWGSKSVSLNPRFA